MKIVFYQDYSQALNNIDIYSSSLKANTKTINTLIFYHITYNLLNYILYLISKERLSDLQQRNLNVDVDLNILQ